jgi:glycosyltransferase involved in cell wall biosynthesis
MKIVHILHELKFSGAEIMYVDAAPVFQKKGCELTVIAGAPNLGEFAPYFKRAGYEVIHEPYPYLKNYIERLKYYRKFVKYLKEENFDVVHIHSHGSMWGISMCSWIAGKKSVYTFHNVFPTSWYSYFYHYIKRWSAKNIFKCKFQTISDSVYDHELKLYGNKTTKLYNWYGSNRFYPAKKNEKDEVRIELDINDKALVLISIGGCSYTKRHHDIIKAIPHIIQKEPNVLYLHLGGGDTEQEEKELTEELGVTKYVRFCSNQRDVRKYLVASDIYIMPSRHEGISITTIESMACRIPSILYDVPGLRDFNKKGENSFLIPEDYKVLAEKIVFLHNQPDEGLRIANNARKMVNEYYNMEKNALEVYKLYL